MNRTDNIFSIVVIVLVMQVGGLLAQDAQTVVDRYLEAIGGAASWRAVKTMTITGDYKSFSVIEPFTLYRARDNQYRFDHHLNRNKVVVACDGRKTWQINPLYDSEAPMWIPNGDSLVVLRDAPIEPVFLDAASKGHRISYLGEEEIDGQGAQVLKIALADSSEEVWYFDRETFLPFKMSGSTYDFGRKVPLETFFTDYRRVGEVMIPFVVEQEFETRYRVYTLASVRLDETLAESLFQKPAE